jgi:hypothetical protein
VSAGELRQTGGLQCPQIWQLLSAFSLDASFSLVTRLDGAECIPLPLAELPTMMYSHIWKGLLISPLHVTKIQQTNHRHHQESILTQSSRRINHILHLVLIVRRICHLKFFASVQRQGDETRPDDKPVLPFWPQTAAVAHMRSKRTMRKTATYLLSPRFFFSR